MNAFAELLIGQAPEFQATLRAAQITAATDVSLLILGESGTGKELLAKAIHRESRRATQPFITINCAALPEGLAESELFGHRRGAFTGASQDQQGRVMAADGGTLFLDEVGELSLTIQAKLLRFLESGECQRLGDTQPRKVNVRVLAATNRDLYNAVQAGRFREDLYYRLHVVPLQLPPLRERDSDIPVLITTLTARLAMQHTVDAPRYSVAALEVMQHYAWPGNIRELRNVCERLVILLSGRTIQPENLPSEIRHHTGLRATIPHLPDDGLVLDNVEADLIQQALSKSHGNQSKAARLLGITRSALIYRMKKFALI